MVIVGDRHLLSHPNGTSVYPADADAPNIFIVVQRGYQHLQGRFFLSLGRGNIFQNRFEQRLQILSRLIGGHAGHPVPAGAVYHRTVQLLLRCVQIQKQLQYLVGDFVGAGVRPVNFIDHYNDPMSQVQRFLQDKAGLRHGPFESVHQKQHAVDHLQNPLYLAAEIRMARGVNNVDLYVLVISCRIFCQNGDAPFPLQIVVVHDPVGYLLVFSEDTALLKHFIHQSCFTVVNVRDDRNISQIISNQNRFLFPLPKNFFSGL